MVTLNQNIVVIKIGGSTLKSETEMEMITDQIPKLLENGITPVLVHGAGPHINAELLKRGIEPSFHNGLRITDSFTLEVVIDQLKEVNQKLSQLLNNKGVATASFLGESALFNCKKQTAQIDLGFVGAIEDVNKEVFSMQSNSVMVVAPIGIDCHGQKYNINADHAAMALASSLKVKTLVYLSDVPGLLKNIEDPDSLIEKLEPDEAKSIIESGSIKGGMIEKLTNSVEAVLRGVEKVCITDGRIEGTLLNASLSQFFQGTTIKAPV